MPSFRELLISGLESGLDVRGRSFSEAAGSSILKKGSTQAVAVTQRSSVIGRDALPRVRTASPRKTGERLAKEIVRASKRRKAQVLLLPLISADATRETT